MTYQEHSIDDGDLRAANQQSEVVRLRKKLADSQKLLHTVLEANLLSFVLVDRSYVVRARSIRATSNARKFLHIEFREGDNLSELVPSSYAKELIASIDAAFEGQTIKRERKFPDQNGQLRYFNFIYSPVPSDSGEIQLVNVSAIDITDRVSVAHALEKSETKYGELYTRTPAMLHSIDNDGFMISVSDYWLEVMGYTREEVIGKKSIDFIAPEFREYARNRITELRGLGAVRDVEYGFIKNNGEIITVLLSAIAEEDDDGEVICYNAVLTDITERKKAEINLRDSEEHFRTLFETSAEGIIISRMSGRILNANRAAARILGYNNAPELLAVNGLGLFADNEIREHFFTELSRNLYVYHHETQLRKKDGTTIEVTGSMNLIHDSRSGEHLVQTIFSDNTERKYAEKVLRDSEEKLRKANATKDTFFSIIAHDLKNPFSAIMGYSEMMDKNFDVYTDEQKRSFVRSIRKAADSTYKLLENLLDWASAQMGIIQFQPVTFNLGELCETTLSALNSTLEAKNIRFTMGIPKNTMVFADENAMTTVLRNLLTNAIKFSEAGGTVMLSTEDLGDEIRVNVADTGTGINSKYLDRLFRIDVRFKRKGTHGEKGSGIGLLLCKEFVERNGGEITVISEEGAGSVFSFTIPKHQSERTPVSFPESSF